MAEKIDPYLYSLVRQGLADPKGDLRTPVEQYEPKKHKFVKKQTSGWDVAKDAFNPFQIPTPAIVSNEEYKAYQDQRLADSGYKRTGLGYAPVESAPSQPLGLFPQANASVQPGGMNFFPSNMEPGMSQGGGSPYAPIVEQAMKEQDPYQVQKTPSGQTPGMAAVRAPSSAAAQTQMKLDPEQEYLRQYNELLAEKQKGLDADTQRMQKIAEMPQSLLGSVDLSPLSNWVDYTTGGSTSKGYKAPTTLTDRRELLEKLKAGVSKGQGELAEGKLNVLKTMATNRDNELDRQLKRQMLNDRMQTQRDLAKLRAQNRPGQKLNSQNYKAAGFGQRMAESHDLINQLMAEHGQRFTAPGYRAKKMLTPDFMEDQTVKAYEQAKSDFITSVLRDESGATIGSSEFLRDEKKYFPQEGDGDAIIQQKAKLRELAVAQRRAEAGGAWNQVANFAGSENGGYTGLLPSPGFSSLEEEEAALLQMGGQ